jgi:hypothetical protein
MVKYEDNNNHNNANIDNNSLLSQQDQENKNIDFIWSKIQSNNATILSTHCFLQFRQKTKTVKDTYGRDISIQVAIPYLFHPNTSLTSQSNDSDHNCYFKEPSAITPTQFTKNEIPSSRFVEILDGDVVVLGKSCYELRFIYHEEPNPYANLDRAMLRGD